MRRAVPPVLLLLLSLAAACGGGPAPATTPRAGATSPERLDSLWRTIGQRVERKQWTRATIDIERYLLLTPFGSPRIPPARYLLGEAYLGDKSNLLAVREFRQVADLYPGDTLAPKALLRAGDAYAALWRRAELDPTDGYSALAVYQEVVTRYPTAPAAEQAKAAIAGLDNKFARKDLKSAEYYLKYKAYDSALIYLRQIIGRWPQADVVPQVLARLVSTYRLLGYQEDVQEVCTYFRINWPAAAELKSSCPATPTPGTPAGG